MTQLLTGGTRAASGQLQLCTSYELTEVDVYVIAVVIALVCLIVAFHNAQQSSNGSR